MDVSRAEKKLKSSLKRLEKLPKEQAEPILKFYQKCMRDGLSYLRINSYMEMLPLLTNRLGKPLDKATENDVERVVSEINNNGSKPVLKDIKKSSLNWSVKMMP